MNWTVVGRYKLERGRWQTVSWVKETSDGRKRINRFGRKNQRPCRFL